MKKILFILPLLVLILSCHEKSREYKEQFLQVEASIDMFPDSSFFSEIRCMQYSEGRIYVLDVGRRDIVSFDENFGNMKITGIPGPGPEDMTAPKNFFVKQDTIYVIDGGSRGIKSFHNNTFVRQKKLGYGSENRFFATSDKFFVPSPRDSSIFAVVSKNEQGLEYLAGKVVRFNTEKQTFIRNERDLLYGEKGSFYAISDNLPFIEEYDVETLRFISEWDISQIPIVRKDLDYWASHPVADNQYRVLIEDSYIFDDSLYLLCAKLGSEYSVNQIIKIALTPERRISSIYLLPGKIYDSFCISDNYIFAFNYNKSSIEKIKLT
jgi:hypothetical protein